MDGHLDKGNFERRRQPDLMLLPFFVGGGGNSQVPDVFLEASRNSATNLHGPKSNTPPKFNR